MPHLEIDHYPAENPINLFESLFSGSYSHAMLTSNKQWIIHRYDDVLRILKDHENFSAIAVKEVMCPIWLDKTCHRSEFIAMQDPPISENNRKIINKLFIRKSIDALIPLMEKSANTLAANFPKQGNFTRQFSYLYISEIMNALLGTNFEPNRIEKWIGAVEGITPQEPHNKQEIEKNITEQRLEFQRLIQDRRKEQRENCVLSDIISEHGNQLTDDDLLNLLELLVGAGFHTTIHMLDHIIVFLTENPDVRKTIKGSNELYPLFVEEMLRLFPTVQYNMRRTNNAVEMPGFTIPADENVRIIMAAANRDPKIFKNPSEFNLFRSNNYQHLTFGAGSHICLGSALAKSELQIATEAIINHLNDVKIVNDQLRKVAMPNVWGVESISIKRNK